MPQRLGVWAFLLGFALPLHLGAQKPHREGPTKDGPRDAGASTRGRLQRSPVWASSEKKALQTPRDRAFVRALDRAWSTGKPDKVLALFDLLHPQVGIDLQARVLGTTGGKPCERKSRILAVTTARSWRALFLSADICASSPRPSSQKDSSQGGQTRVIARLFEIAVIPNDESGSAAPIQKGLKSLPKGRLLLETLPESQAHVMSPEAGSRPPSIGSPITPGARYRCLPCNFEIGIPEPKPEHSPLHGGWFLIGRPPFLSGNYEQVEIYHLESDFSVELVVHPDPSRGMEYMKQCLLGACCNIAAFHDMDPEGVRRQHEEPRMVQLDGRRVLVTTFEAKKTAHVPGRAFLLLGYQHAPADYFLSFQGPPGSLSIKDPRVLSIFETFRILQPDRARTMTMRLAMAAHGGGGAFVGNDFSHPALGLLQPGIPKWKTFRKLGITRFHIGWKDPDSGSSLFLAALERPQADWTENSMRCWFDAWIRSQDQNFGKLGKPQSIQIAGTKGLRLEFKRHTPQGKTIRGFQILLFRGKLLYLLRGQAMPGPRQREILDLLRDRAMALQLR
ncbi:MAG TPA: hypothetical protein ENK02_00195 [Planctomycetes bacterium]|nr:hypothetical protein [Planctomycetota bacterium]